MLTFILLCVYLCAFSFILGLIPLRWEQRPTLQTMGFEVSAKKRFSVFNIFRKLALINKPLCTGALRRRIVKDLLIGHANMSPDEFFLIKELIFVLILFFTFPIVKPDAVFAWIALSLVFGYLMPEMWLKGRIRRAKDDIVKQLPDAIDLLGLCVNAGLDFMLALKWVVEKSASSIMIEELNNLLQEINVGKTRREAIKDLALKYDIPDLSTFSRTLIQADKMGTSVTEALNILSEDMRLARFRRGEQMALKAPLKMLIPLLVCIFPVVAILVAGPIILDFIENNPLRALHGR